MLQFYLLFFIFSLPNANAASLFASNFGVRECERKITLFPLMVAMSEVVDMISIMVAVQILIVLMMIFFASPGEIAI